MLKEDGFHGQGTLVHPSGDKHVGAVQMGLYDGHDSLTWVDGIPSTKYTFWRLGCRQKAGERPSAYLRGETSRKGVATWEGHVHMGQWIQL
jgi:hypothetical protein